MNKGRVTTSNLVIMVYILMSPQNLMHCHSQVFWKVIELCGFMPGLLLGGGIWPKEVDHWRCGLEGFISPFLASLLMNSASLQLSTKCLLHALPDLEPQDYGLKPLKTASHNKLFDLYIVSVRYFVSSRRKVTKTLV